MPRWHAYLKFTHRWELPAVAAAVNTTRRCCQMRPGSLAPSSSRGTSILSHWAAVRQADVQGGGNAARTSIMASRTDHIRTQLQQASGDIRATRRTAQSLLHSWQKVIYDDSECADLVGKFSSFFVDKVRRIRDNIASALQQSSPRVFAARPHTGPELSDFQPVTIDEVRKLLSSIAAGRYACHSTEGLRGSLCTGHHHTRQLVTADRKVPSTL